MKILDFLGFRSKDEAKIFDENYDPLAEMLSGKKASKHDVISHIGKILKENCYKKTGRSFENFVEFDSKPLRFEYISDLSNIYKLQIKRNDQWENIAFLDYDAKNKLSEIWKKRLGDEQLSSLFI